ncbi:hypothetical protein E4U11_008229 [Claviceps purpurea]|nr:hypothetical protein E4U11_008229 [Claviceps purpurea]
MPDFSDNDNNLPDPMSSAFTRPSRAASSSEPLSHRQEHQNLRAVGLDSDRATQTSGTFGLSLRQSQNGRRGREVTESTVTLLLESSPSLEHLVFHNIWEQTLPAHQNKWTQLKHISLSSQGDDFNHVEVDREGGFPQTFLQNAASSLEHLNFKGIPLSWYRGKAPHLPQLKTLRMGGAFEDNGSFPILWIGPDIPYLDVELVALEKGRWEDLRTYGHT